MSSGPEAGGPDANVTRTADSVSSVGESERRLQVLHVQPGDVLLIGNAGDVPPTAMERVLARLKDVLPSLAEVVVFVGDIDVTLLRDIPADLREPGVPGA